MRWEYTLLDSKDTSGEGLLARRSRAEVVEYLNALGDEGWEIVNLDFSDGDGVTHFVGLARRPKDR